MIETKKLNNTEKIKFYIPERTDRVIRSDAEQFEIFKANGEDINLNRFLTLLIVGYYNGYKQEINETTEAIRGIISHYIKGNRQKDDLTAQLMDQVIQPEVLKRNLRSLHLLEPWQLYMYILVQMFQKPKN